MTFNWDDPLSASKPNVSEKKPTLKVVTNEKTSIKDTAAVVAKSAPSTFTPMQPINPEDKRVINGMGDINQLAPFKYPWAWDFFLNANKNHWTPLDINMAQDVQDYHHKLKPEERHVYENVLAYLTTSDILAMRNIGLAVMEKMTAPELQIYQARQVYEEALHCYIEGTEVLTEHGFIDFRDVKEDTLVAQYHDDGHIDFVKHLGKTVDHFKGDLVEFKNGVAHSVVTPNHWCCYRPHTRPSHGKLLRARASELPIMAQLPTCASSGADGELSAYSRLRIAYQADGFLDGKRIAFNFKKERKIRRLIELLDALPYKYDVKHYGDVTRIHICGVDLVDFDKEFSWVDVLHMQFGTAREFIEELMHWDGNVHMTRGTRRYSNTNLAALSKVQAVAVLGGFHPRLEVSGTQLNLVDTNYISAQSFEHNKVPYDGKVYSVGVPTRNLVVRYNGKVVISQNTWTYQHCIETLGLDQSEIYNRYRVVPEINAKIQIANRRLNAVMRSDMDLTNRDDLHQFVLSYVFFAAIFEGCWFYNGFSPIFALQRRGLMKGTAEQLQYIMRDEVMHCSFGIRVARQIMVEENMTLDDKAVQEMWEEADAAEEGYAKFLLPNPILGYSAADHHEQFRFTANRRARQLGLNVPFEGAQNALPWLDEQSNMRKEKNFFETRVTEYQTGGALKWD